MLARPLLSLILCAVLGSNVVAAIGAESQAVYFDGGQYTAALQQHARHWHLLPLQGADVDVIEHASTCVNRMHIPHGVWVVTSDSAGRPQLVAPSATVLPAGFPQQLELRACGDNSGSARTDGARTDSAAALLVPAMVLDWIKANVSSVMIDD
jgi:hypothetical protein